MIKLNTFGPLKNEFKVEGAKSFAEVKILLIQKVAQVMISLVG